MLRSITTSRGAINNACRIRRRLLWTPSSHFLCNPAKNDEQWHQQRFQEGPDLICSRTLALSRNRWYSNKSSENNERNFGDGPPTIELRSWYTRNYPSIEVISDVASFKREKYTLPAINKGDNHSHWWTATFICPVSHQHYEAGSLPDVKPRLYANGKVYYPKLKTATAAASARAIDSLRYSDKEKKGNDGNILSTLCLEHPSTDSEITSGSQVEHVLQVLLKKNKNSDNSDNSDNIISGELGIQEAILLQENDDISRVTGYVVVDHETVYNGTKPIVREKQSMDGASDNSKPLQTQQTTEKKSFDNSNSNFMLLNTKEPPKYRLKQWYFLNFPQYGTLPDNISFKKEIYVSKVDGKTWWTSSFICPPYDDDSTDDSVKYNAGSLSEEKPRLYVNGKVYYLKLKQAIAAASASALDHIQNKERVNDKSLVEIPKLCLEDPTLIAESCNSSKYKSPTEQVLEDLLRTDRDSQNIDGSITFDTEEEILLLENGNVVRTLLPSSKEEEEAEEDDFVNTDYGDTPKRTPPPSPYYRITGLTHYPSEENENDTDDEDEGEEDSSGDEYIVQYVPGSSASFRSGGDESKKTTFERVMNAWAKSTQLQKSRNTVVNSVLPMLLNPSQQRNNAIRGAISWYDSIAPSSADKDDKDNYKRGLRKQRRRGKHESKRHRTMFQTSGNGMNFNTSTGTYILETLADASSLNDLISTQPTQEKESQDGDWAKEEIESIASKIIDLLWEKSLEGEEPPPNADTYNAYIRCLWDADRAVRVDKARSIMDGMINGGHTKDGKHILPKPNVGTVNIMMQLEARTGSTSKVEELYNALMEDTTENVSPNKETFLSMMSCMANGSKDGEYHPNFSPHLAREWIKRMEQLHEMRPEDGTLCPDVDVYNAPLRRSNSSNGSLLSLMIPWDQYEIIFKDGFKADHEVTLLMEEARLMEKWLDSMENGLDKIDDAGTQPNQNDDTNINQKTTKSVIGSSAETYESVIQSWIRTGTRTGLKKAESLASRALDTDGICPQLTLFHPILAAWAYSGDQNSPGKVQDWIDHLESLKSLDYPEVKPDGRIRALPITAWRLYQKRLIGESRGEDDNEKNHAILEASNECAASLSSLCGELRQTRVLGAVPDFYLEGKAFLEVIDSWGNLGLYSYNKEAFFSKEEAIKQVLLVVKLLDDTIELYRKLEFEQIENVDVDGDTQEDNEKPILIDEWHTRQLRHLMQVAPKVYAHAISTLNEIDSIDDDEEHKKDLFQSTGSIETSFSKFLPHVETMLRRSEEYHIFLKSHRSLKEATADNKTGDYIDNHEKDENQQYDDTITFYNDMFMYNTFDYPIQAKENISVDSSLRLYQQILSGCKNLTSAQEIGDALRLCMLIQECVKRNSLLHSFEATNNKDAGIRKLYDDMMSVISQKVSNKKERESLLAYIGDSVSSFVGSGNTGYSNSMGKNRVATSKNLVSKIRVSRRNLTRRLSKAGHDRRRSRSKQKYKKI